MQTTKVATLEHSRPRKNTRLLGIGVGLVLSFLLLAAASTAYMSGLFVNANNDAPQELIVRKVTDTTTEIYWSTQNETQGLIQYGTNPTELTLIAPEVIGGTDHSLNLTLLKPATTYYFNLKIGETVFDNGGVPWTFATKATSADGVSAPEGQEIQPTSSNPPATTCPVTSDCMLIKRSLGLGCSTTDYYKCLQGK